MRNYRRGAARDPYWTTAKFDSADNPDSRGGPIKKGARIFFYPSTRAAYVGAAAEKAAADFEAARSDEAFYNGE